MIEEDDTIGTLMVSYFIRKDTDDDGTPNGDGGRIRDAGDLARSALLLSL